MASRSVESTTLSVLLTFHRNAVTVKWRHQKSTFQFFKKINCCRSPGVKGRQLTLRYEGVVLIDSAN